MTAGVDGIRIEVDHAVATVTLDRPDALNAPDRAVHTALTTLWSEVAALEGVRAVVLTGAGRAFSAGSDRSLLQQLLDDEAVRDEVLAEAAAILLDLVGADLPVVAAVNGPAVGLGCSLVAACDLVVMADDTYLSDPHVLVGLGGGDGAGLTWPVLTPLLLAKEAAILGTRIGAEQALDVGLANRVVPRADVVATAQALAAQLADRPAQSMQATKRVLNRGLLEHLERGLPVALDAERRSFQIDENRAALAVALQPRRPAATNGATQ